MSLDWALDGQYLLQRSTIPDRTFPDSLAIIAAWERRDNEQDWHTDFTLTNTRIPTTSAGTVAGRPERTNAP
jgi:hypothetical protein